MKLDKKGKLIINIFNTEMKASKSISSHIYFFHPYGIVINSDSVIKDHVVIRQQVTIGNKGETKSFPPNSILVGVPAKNISSNK